MLTDCDFAIDLTVAVGDDMEGDAEIARPIDLITLAIPRTPKSGLGILPVINELHDPRLDLRHTSQKLVMEVGAHPVLDEIAPTMSEVNAAETRYHRIQSASEVFAR